MIVLGPKHVGAFLMCKFYKFYICAVVGAIIESQAFILLCLGNSNVLNVWLIILSAILKF